MNKRAIQAAGLFLLWMHLFSGARAQQILFRNYAASEGLPSNTVWCISQDDQGYMWFGTKNGLGRFDGYQFKSYRFDKQDPRSIGNNFIHVICRYDSTTYWIGTEGGVYTLDLEKERFSAFEPVPYAVHDIIRDSRGNFWVATRGRGVFRYDPRSGELDNFRANDRAGSLSANQARKLAEDHQGHIWIGTFGRGIDVLDPASGHFRRYRAGSTGLASDHILTLHKGLDGEMWIGTLKGGLSVYDPEKDAFKTYLKSRGNSISDDIVRAIYQPAPDKLYLGTEKGLNILHIPGERFTSYVKEADNPYSISDNAVYSIFPDKEGGIWLGTFFGGVDYFREEGNRFELYYPKSGSQSLSGNAVSNFLEDGPGRFWIGTEDGGLNYFDAAGKTFKHYPFSPEQEALSYHNIHALFKDREGKIWIGTFTGGLNVYDPSTGEVKIYKKIPGDSTSLSSNSIYVIEEDEEGAIWVGTVSGLQVYDPENDAFIRASDRRMRNNCIYRIYDDGAGTIWVATYDNGLFTYHKRSGKWERFSSRSNGTVLSSDKVISLLDDRKGNLWIGTDGGGLNRYNFREKTFRVYGRKDGISANVIYGILQDDDGFLWITSNNGLFRLDPATDQVRHYTVWDHLQSPQFNYKSALKASDGKLYMGGIKGFNAFYPDSVSDACKPGPVVFTNFQLFNKDVPISERKSPLSKHIGLSEHLTLSHDQSVISFEYASLSFAAPEEIHYAYKMEGFDKQWNEVGGQRKATYTNLPPGDYTFRVRASGDNANWGKATGIRITVKPPFYRTNLAYIAYVVLGLGLAFGLRRYLIRQARKKNQIRLERLKNKREQEFYRQKIDFFTAMAHEIRTPLSLIMAPLEKLIASATLPDKEQKQLRLINENSGRLSHLVNQLLDFRRIESDIYEIHPEEVEVVSLVHAIYSRFSSVPYQKNLKFAFSTNVNRLVTEADPEALAKILNNLLINAVKFSRTTIKIRVDEPETDVSGHSYVAISVEDDGIGIPATEIDHIFKKFIKVSSGEHHYSNLGGTGIGLALAKSLAEKHEGKLLVTSTEGINTTFRVLIPYTGHQAAAYEPFAHRPEAGTPDGTFREKGSRILVAEDDPAMLDFISRSLYDEGYCVLKASNGREVLDLLEKHTVDLVLSDLMMPEVDGLECCKRVKSDINHSHIPFVLLTAKANSEAEIAGVENGADAYIVKPFIWKHLAAVVKNLLESRALLRLKFSQQPFEAPNSLTTNKRDKTFIEKIMQIIEERMTDPQLSVEELSKDMAMSRSSLHKKLKSLSGYVPNEFIRLIRLKRAAKLLLENENPISEISYLVGFNSHSYFSKCFMKQFGLSPKEFVDRHVSSNQPIELP